MNRISLHIYERDLGAVRTILLATAHESKELDVLSPLTEEARKRAESRDLAHVLMINRPDRDPVVMRIVNRPELDPIAELVTQQLKLSTNVSSLVMRLTSDGVRLGTVVLRADGRDIFTEEHARLFALLHDPFAIALSNALEHQEVMRLRDVLADDCRYLHRELFRLSGDEIVGSRTGLRSVMDMVDQVSHSTSPVLLLGETGVGKDVIANAIHHSSPRKDGPFIKVNCGAIPDSLMDSELFGHEKGAFTGAVAQNRGCFERAKGGTIYLDEIAELPPAAQVRMLRVIQYKEVQRVGGSSPIRVDIRVVAATHRNLEEMVRTGKFREDLWFRLNVFPIRVPPLRKRKDDIPALVSHFIQRKARDLRLSELPALGPGAMDQLLAYDWPGNVREMENIIERALILSGTGPLTFGRFHLDEAHEEAMSPATDDPVRPLDDVVASHIRRTLKKTRGRIHGPDGAAELLKVNANTLRSRMDKLNIPYGRPKTAANR